MSTPATTPDRRRVKKRLLIPAIVLVVLVVLLLWAYLRGTWADTVARNPQTSAEGTVTQLYRTPQGEVQVRCAIVIDAPVARVWAVVHDYASHPRFLPYVSALEVQPKEGDRVYLTGSAHSRLWGDWPFAMHMNHKMDADKKYTASWDESGDTLTVNRGSWALTAVNPRQTLVVLTIQWEAPGYASFFIHNLLLDRLPKMLYGLRDEVNRREEGA
jgi:uncharacterized membrane protein